MFDITFFQAVADLKERIVSGGFSPDDAEKIAADLEAMKGDYPFVFNLETTNYCNMRCVMCPRTSLMTRKEQWIDDDDYRTVLDQIRPHDPEALQAFWGFVGQRYGIAPDARDENHFYFHISSKYLTLHGYGEPLLDRKIVEHVAICSERGVPTYFSCVPANIDVEKIVKLMEAGLGVLKFSMDALDDEGQKRIRGKHNDFTQSYDKILQVLAEKRRLGLETVIVLTLISMGTDDAAREMEKAFIAMWADKEVYSYVKSQDNRWYFEDDEAVENASHYAQQYCEYPWTSLSVMADGEVVPCTQDYNSELSLGNVREASLETIWNGEKYRQFREWHVTGAFPEGHKCAERCDQIKLHSYLQKTE